LHIVIPPADIEFGKVFCTFEPVDEVVHEGEGIAILSDDQIECTVVLYKAKFFILLLDEEDQSAYW
jgi:hypothetical protein